MAGSPGLRNGFGVDRCDDSRLGNFIDEADLVTEKSKEEGNGVRDGVLRGLFDQVLYGFFKDLNVDSATKPLPALLYDGRPVDLFMLFCLVKNLGGFNVVSKEKLWGNIALGMGLDFNLSTFLQSIYLKYLDQLDKWLNIISKDGNLVNSSSEYHEALQLLLVELEKGFTPPTVDGGKLVTVGDDHNLQILGSGRDNNSEGEDGKNVDPGPLEGENESQRRKRKDMEGMLCWMNEIAKNPRGWSDAAGKELMSTVLLMQEARLKKKYTSHQKKKQRVGPSLYDNDPPAHHVEATRFSSRVPTMAKTLECSCCSASSTKRKRVTNHSKATTTRLQGKCHLTHHPRPMRTRYQINVGPEFQAEIPPWTGQASEDDSKSAGTRVWLPTNLQDTVDDDLVFGKGRSEVCECPSPGTVKCVRLHTAENGTKLKNELGEAFYQWRFDQMGEVFPLTGLKKRGKTSRN